MKGGEESARRSPVRAVQRAARWSFATPACCCGSLSLRRWHYISLKLSADSVDEHSGRNVERQVQAGFCSAVRVQRRARSVRWPRQFPSTRYPANVQGSNITPDLRVSGRSATNAGLSGDCAFGYAMAGHATDLPAWARSLMSVPLRTFWAGRPTSGAREYRWLSTGTAHHSSLKPCTQRTAIRRPSQRWRCRGRHAGGTAIRCAAVPTAQQRAAAGGRSFISNNVPGRHRRTKGPLVSGGLRQEEALEDAASTQGPENKESGIKRDFLTPRRQQPSRSTVQSKRLMLRRLRRSVCSLPLISQAETRPPGAIARLRDGRRSASLPVIGDAVRRWTCPWCNRSVGTAGVRQQRSVNSSGEGRAKDKGLS